MTDGRRSMERVRDFSPYELKVSVYDGAAEKRTMLMDGHLYMVKFGYDAAPQEEHPSRTSYVNLPVNEYIGSKVFAASGIPTQDVILGDYKGRSVVACRDRRPGPIGSSSARSLTNMTRSKASARGRGTASFR